MIDWLRTFLSRDPLPFLCDEIRVFWRRSGWHAYIQYGSDREDKPATWAYGTLGSHVLPDDDDDLATALWRAISIVLQKARRAGIRWADEPSLYFEGRTGTAQEDAALSAAARLGWSCSPTPRR